jgi:hypothetical protein
MNGHSISDWHDVLNPEHMNIKFVEGFETCIADNVMQKKGRENPGKDLNKRFQR